MKKHRLAFLVLCITIIYLVPVHAFAMNGQDVGTTIYNEDGSYVVVTISTDNLLITRASKTRTATVKHDYHNAAGDLDWTASMTASFSYDGLTSRCTSVGTPVITIYDNIWSVYSKSSSKNSNTATGNITMAVKQLIGTSKFPVTMTLTCDKNGNVS